MLIIGERINSSRKLIAKAIENRDAGFIQNEAKLQTSAGADFIDVNAGSFAGEEEDHLKWLVDTVQRAVATPLCIDSPDPRVIRSVLPLVESAPMVNSITLEPVRLETILPLAMEHKAKVIGLCQSEETLSNSKEAKMDLAGQLVEKISAAGLPVTDFYIDPLVYPVATDSAAPLEALKAIAEIMEAYPGVHTTCGLTNVSHGMPKRKLINRTFLAAAVCYGLDCAIIDPTDPQLYGALLTALMLAGKDDFCTDYIGAYREGRLD